MAKSQFEYVRRFELSDELLPDCWIVVRLDGRSFHRFTDVHEFAKPNDERGLSLMNEAARRTASEFNDVVLAYGQSDEFSFLIRPCATVYKRRSSKLATGFASFFTACYVSLWPTYFGDAPLRHVPSFDGRCVVYPSDRVARDYFSWRQADCHINNLYNTCLWALVQRGGLTTPEATARLGPTNAAAKNELLFSEFDTNYNNEPVMYRKGSVLVRESVEMTVTDSRTGQPSTRTKKQWVVKHMDLITNEPFWAELFHDRFVVGNRHL